jgi:phage shock protein A
MREKLDKINSNIGNIKGEIAVLKDKISENETKISNYEDKASLLIDAGNEELAAKNCAAADRIQAQIDSLKETLKIQSELLDEQIAARDELKNAIEEADSDLITMQAMKDVTDAHKNLITINKNDGINTVAAVKKRKEELKKQMVKSKAMKEESRDPTSLEKETEKVLGKKSGSSRLARLKAKKG